MDTMMRMHEATARHSAPVTSEKSLIPPGGTIGVLGGGQLGRMFTHAAQRLGYRVHVLSPHGDSPTGQVADREIIASFDDLEAVEAFAIGVDVVTLEWENVPIATVQRATRRVPVRPAAAVLHTVQHRLREKTFLRDEGIPCTPFRAVRSPRDLEAAVDELGCPAILKTAQDGYDGKGQYRINSPAEVDAAWREIGGREGLLEGFVEFERELSVVVARGEDGRTATYGPVVNEHSRHILDVSVMPHPAVAGVAGEANDLAGTIARQLDVIGIICVEFFLATDGRVLVNEIAPRPHNSGHLTIEACLTSQFEQYVRAACGLPLGAAEQLRPAAMANLLGELWEDGEPHWSRALASDKVKLHLYGKRHPRRGRKMGHLTAMADTPEQAERLVRAARDALSN